MFDTHYCGPIMACATHGLAIYSISFLQVLKTAVSVYSCLAGTFSNVCCLLSLHFISSSWLQLCHKQHGLGFTLSAILNTDRAMNQHMAVS